MGCGTSRPREMQVIHSPYPWYGGGRIAPILEPDESFINVPPNHSTGWWFSDQLDINNSYIPHHVLVPPEHTCTGEPPPYTEVAQNGHISLMHGRSSIKPEDPPQEGDNNTDMDSGTSMQSNNVSAFQDNESALNNSYMESSPLIHAMADSSPNTLLDSPPQNLVSQATLEGVAGETTQNQGPFHPTRQSTPILERRLQLPPLHRSRSIDTPDAPMTGDGNRQQRLSLPSVSLSLHSSLPPRLRPLSTLFGDDVSTNENATDNEENAGPFPVRPGRLPPLQSALNRQDEQRRFSINSGGPNQFPRQRKKKRRRTNSWHGESLGSELIHTIQEVNTLGVVTE